MYREKTIVFVEVKARGTAKHGRPVEAVGKQKEDILARTAAAYCRKINWEKAVRFDTISVILRENSLPFLEHFEDAFWPGWK
jgi:putative endonuclease